MEGWQRAFVLHARPYSETSLLLDFFTEHQGRVRVLAKGARSRRSSLKGILQPFTPLLARWRGRSELKTLRSAEPVSLCLPLTGIMLYSGLYINELLSRVLAHETDDSSTLFYDYLQCLQWLAGATGSPEPVLRRFELALLTHLGYGVDFLHCAGSGDPVDDAMTYRYREEKGFIASALLDHYSFSGCELRALAAREFPDVDALRAAKRFTRMALKPYLGGKPLKSRELFRQFLHRRRRCDSA
ncbi:DNA repair protein RecO [Sodalis-like endosymbiont of Proechinophthirus fluctus]|uniref:DNA repair protein RecO n=1 Tax=Sodalis-like endosymbiont of Proechinophthirus fluctus TaxID=1462730 RepID=UPI0007A86D8E|nr:DNA repair protein RecO [Sodalis-like endosymbiont of Proechinophthirus fluctus]KYP97031.1 DNA repair protein RecO [Sodalis-like endosymbiont of Proechinophthirus fluctus]